MGERIIIPYSMRKEVLNTLHVGHLGITRTKSRARQLIYWPGIDQEIENMIGKCSLCQKYQKKNVKESLLPHDIPNIPFQKVGCDIFEWGGKSFLIIIDYYSKWIEFKVLKNKSASEVIDKWVEIFSSFGVPKTLIADNNPFNSFECREFARKWDFEILTSSPLHAKSNGMAERSVQIIKNILRKSKNKIEIHVGLMEYRNTPLKDINLTPSQLLQGRICKTLIPMKLSLAVKNFNENIKEKTIKL